MEISKYQECCYVASNILNGNSDIYIHLLIIG